MLRISTGTRSEVQNNLFERSIPEAGVSAVERD